MLKSNLDDQSEISAVVAESSDDVHLENSDKDLSLIGQVFNDRYKIEKEISSDSIYIIFLVHDESQNNKYSIFII